MGDVIDGVDGVYSDNTSEWNGITTSGSVDDIVSTKTGLTVKSYKMKTKMNQIQKTTSSLDIYVFQSKVRSITLTL
jgi:hypothetical protein